MTMEFYLWHYSPYLYSRIYSTGNQETLRQESSRLLIKRNGCNYLSRYIGSLTAGYLIYTETMINAKISVQLIALAYLVSWQPQMVTTRLFRQLSRSNRLETSKRILFRAMSRM